MKGKKTRRAIWTLSVILTIALILFLFYGLTSKNVDYYLPRRFMKALTILIVSYCIGYSTVSFQTITNNTILTPSVIGLDSLYTFIQTVVVYLFGSRTLSMLVGVPNFLISVGFMLLGSGLLFFFLFRGDRRNVYFIVLAGMVLGSLFGGMSSFMQVLLDPNEFAVLEGRMFASFSKINEDLFYICLIISFITIIISYTDIRKMDVLALGAEQAISLGVNYHRLVLKQLMIISVLVSISTVLVGPITFLGILIVSISRKIVPDYRHSLRIVSTILLGAIALIVGLLITERILHFATTLSVIINFIGGIYFLVLIIRESRNG